MPCSQGHENPRGAVFCVECGERLSVTPKPIEVIATSISTTTTGSNSSPPADPPQSSRTTPSLKIGRKTVLRFGGGITAVIVIAVLGFGAYTLTKTPVPDVTGFEVVAAKELITEQGLSLNTGGSEFSDSIPKDFIVRQVPSPGSRVSSGSVVEIFMSRGPAVATPDMGELAINQARVKAKAAGLLTKETKESSETIPVGQVISQSPKPGIEVEEGTSIELLVSSGPPTTTVTYLHDISIGVLAYNSECSPLVILLSLTSRSPAIANGNDKVISTASGWKEHPENGSYFPCKAQATFLNVPTNEDNYQFWFDPTNPEDNFGETYSRSEMERAKWLIDD